MTSPEVFLHGLNMSMIDLPSCLAPRFKGEKDVEVLAQFKAVLRRTFTLELLNGKAFIAIAGAQGAGRTTPLSLGDHPAVVELPATVGVKPSSG